MKTLSIVRVEVHDYFWKISIPIEDELRRIVGDVDNPVERFNSKEMSAKPNTTMANEDAQLGYFHFHFIVHFHLSFFCCIFYPVKFIAIEPFLQFI